MISGVIHGVIRPPIRAALSKGGGASILRNKTGSLRLTNKTGSLLLTQKAA